MHTPPDWLFWLIDYGPWCLFFVVIFIIWWATKGESEQEERP